MIITPLQYRDYYTPRISSVFPHAAVPGILWHITLNLKFMLVYTAPALYSNIDSAYI